MRDEPSRRLPASVCAKRARSRLICGAVLTLAVFGIAACGASGGQSDSQTGRWGGTINPGSSPVRGGTLSVALHADPPAISPIYFDLQLPDQQTIKVMMQMFDQLVEQRPGSLAVQPGIAKSWTASKNGLTYTFKLRKAAFSNGMPITSDDVKYSLDLVRSSKSFFVDLFSSVTAVDAPDPTTVVIHLSQPTPALLYYLSDPAASIVPAKVVKQEGIAAFNKNPIGSGPFKLQRWERGQEVDLVRNDHYWRPGRPYLSGVTFVSTADDNSRVLSVESGTTDASDVIPFASIDSIDKGASAKVLIAPGAETYSVQINDGLSPYDELAVRRALNYATPGDSIVNAVFHGHAKRANSELPPLKYWSDKDKPYPYDLNKARQLLKQSSVPNGFTAQMDIDPNSEVSRQVGQIMQQSWSKIGINLKLEQPDAATLNDQFVKGTYQMILGAPGDGMSDVPVEDEFAGLLYNSPETHDLYTFNSKSKATQLTKQATHELNPSRRASLFAELHTYTITHPASIPLIFTPNTIAVSDKVHDLSYLLCGWFLLDGTWLAK